MRGPAALPRSDSGYNPLLDGLRAVAVVAVIGDHAGLHTHGFHGVTLFFVISGYLITTLLVREEEQSGSLSFRRFYWRRLVRLGPALLVVLVATVAYLLLIGRSPGTFWVGLVGALTYTMDLVQAFAGNGGVGIHFQWSWSLGVEEQFYLLWPLALLLLLRRRRRLLIVGLLALVAVAWVLRTVELASGASHEAVFFGPATHADAIALGALVALVRARWSPGPAGQRVVGAAALIGGVGLLLMEFRVGTGLDAMDPDGFGQAAVFSTAVVLWASCATGGPIAQILSVPPLAYLGRLSYGLYLWNILTIVVFVGITGRHPAQTPLGAVWLAALVLVAAASHRWIERPLRYRWATPPTFRAEA